MFIEMIERRYHQECREWIKGLSEKQLKLISKYIFEEDEFEVFKQRIDNSNQQKRQSHFDCLFNKIFQQFEHKYKTLGG